MLGDEAPRAEAVLAAVEAWLNARAAEAAEVAEAEAVRAAEARVAEAVPAEPGPVDKGTR